MTNKTRKQLFDLVSRLEALRDEMESIRDDLESYADDEQEKHDNLSEGLQYSELGERLEQSAEALTTAYECLDVDVIDEAIDAINEAIDAQGDTMTTEQAINAFFDWCEGRPSDFDNCVTKQSEHGKVVDYRMEAYCDVMVYEDGYEERYYIGD